MLKEKMDRSLLINQNIPFARECLEGLKNGNITLGEGTDIDKNQALQIYQVRYEIMKDSHKPDRVSGYEILLKNLEEYKGKKVNIRLLKGTEAVYIMFIGVCPQQLIGILRTNRI